MVWLIYALLSSVTWGLATIFVRIAMERVDSTLVTTMRTFMMSMFLFLVAFVGRNITRSSILAVEMKDWLYILAGSIASCVAWLFYFGAFKHGDVSKVVSIDRLSFVLILFMSAFVFDEPLTKKMLVGAGFMVLGICLIASK